HPRDEVAGPDRRAREDPRPDVGPVGAGLRLAQHEQLPPRFERKDVAAVTDEQRTVRAIGTQDDLLEQSRPRRAGDGAGAEGRGLKGRDSWLRTRGAPRGDQKDAADGGSDPVSPAHDPRTPATGPPVPACP